MDVQNSRSVSVVYSIQMFEVAKEQFEELANQAQEKADAAKLETTKEHWLGYKRALTDQIKLLDAIYQEVINQSPSYFLYKPDLKQEDLCHNANTKLCKKCHQPECDLAEGYKHE